MGASKEAGHAGKVPTLKGQRQCPGETLNTLQHTEMPSKCLQGDTRVQGMDGPQIATEYIRTRIML